MKVVGGIFAAWSGTSFVTMARKAILSAGWARRVVGVFLWTGVAAAQSSLTIANPHWNITLTDYGYSDFLLDNTPGFQGREYLSGEWGAAVSYQVAGHPVVAPQWLEPHFSYPDWTTPSTFAVVSPMTDVGLNASGLPVAQSVIANSDVRITIRCEMLDTIIGTPMGTLPASAGGAGSAMHSDRYVLQQTYTIMNTSGASISGMQLFQFLHGLQSQRGTYDDRLYAGSFSAYRYDMSLVGVDASAVGAGSSASGLEDYIAFHSSVAPTAHEIGYYGVEGNGIDLHVLGKPSEGVHLSIEDNWQSAPYSVRQGTDSFAPVQRWIAGAQRWPLGNLAAGQSVSFDVLLSVCTGTKVDPGTSSSGGCNGGSSVPGGLDYVFDDVVEPGTCFVEYAQADSSEIEARIAHGDFGALNFPLPGGVAQVWVLTFSGVFTGAVTLTLGYDPMLLPSGFDESSLRLHQFEGGAWLPLAGTVDTALHTITVVASNLSAFALGVDGSAVYTVGAEAAPSGSGTVAGAGTYADGSQCTLVAAASGGYAFSNWTENDVVVSSSPSYTFVVHSNRALVAHFSVAGEAKTVSTGSQPSHGGATGGDGIYAAGAEATVTATAAGGYKFSKWLLNGVTVSTISNYTFTVASNVVLVAKFKPVFRVMVSADPVSGGEIEVDAAYELGELAQLKSVPASGYSLENWTENGLIVSTDPIYQFAVSGNRELVAHFAEGYRIDASVSPSHSGDVTGSGVHPSGTIVCLIANANPGYVFLNWTENGTVVGTDTSYVLSSEAQHMVVANFLRQPALRLLGTAPNVLRLTWSADATEWGLQECSDLTANFWTNSARQVDLVGAQKEVEIAPSEGRGFFRLRYP